MKLFPTDTIEKLEFDKILSLLEEKCLSDLGREKLQKTKLSTDATFITKCLRQVYELKSAIENGVHFPAQNYLSLTIEIKQLGIQNNILEGKQFRKIYNVLSTIKDIIDFFKKYPEEYETLRLLIKHLDFDEKLMGTIDKIIDEDGKVRSNASPELVSIRRRMQSKNSALNKVFGKLVQELKQKGVLADSNESIRNNRRVLAVQAENKRTIGGIIHDESDSGRTSYIEPEGTVLLNNELFELEREEKREIYKILQQLTADIANSSPLLQSYTQLLSNFDVIRAKALLALEMDAQMPIVVKNPTISLKEAYHPLLYLLNKKAKKETVPCEVSLDKDQCILLISGPNAGGKSVTLKTIGLIQTMVQFGLLVPCSENSQLGIFQSIFTDLGDNQSIENELSTYSSRLKRMKHFLANANSKTLYLIDEFGTGTDPRFGAAMAEAILNELISKNAFGIITTHYSNLKKLAEQEESIVNGAMLFNENNFEPTYRLKTGKPGSSYTFAIAEKSGLDNQLIENAKSLVDYSDLKFDELLEKVEKERKTLERENSRIKKENLNLKKLMQKFEKLNQQTERQINLLRQQHIDIEKQKEVRVEQEVNQMLNKINNAHSKKVAAQKEAKRSKERQEILQHKTHEIETLSQEEVVLKVNDRVLIKDTDIEADIIELRGKKVVIFYNGIKSTLPKDRLLKIKEVTQKQNFTVRRKIKLDRIENVFDIRGLMQHDSRIQVEQYFDQALLNSLDSIKIIHGRGTGVLRKTVRAVIKDYHQNVLDWEYEDDKKGGNGATIIRFK